ncbi:MAG: hypothetical protein HC843_01350 [Sphingomonadales bacterium]|nr:hypothetical protein [Sphingomonadales bacterium]
MTKKLKFTVAAAALALSAPFYLAPAMAQDDSAEAAPAMSEKDQQVFEMLNKIFEVKDAPPIAPAQLALAQKTMIKILPPGSYAKIMTTMMDKFMKPLFGEIGGEMTADEVMAATGLYEDGIAELNQEQRKAITAVLDPDRKDRMAKMAEQIGPFMNKAMFAIEAPIREGMARAYARKFSAAQLTELNRFFDTPTGAFYAEQSFALQADPEVLQATFAALPAVMAEFKDSPPGLAASMNEASKTKTALDLNEDDLTKLAGLLGVSMEKMQEGQEFLRISDAEAAGAEAAGEAAEGAAEYAEETGDEPWYDSSNWSKSEQAELDKLSTVHDEAQTKATGAYEMWESAYDKTVASYREKYKAQGWKPEPAAEEAEVE